MILRSGSRDVHIHQGQSSPCMHPVWLGVDSGVPVTSSCGKLWYLAKGRFWSSPVRICPLESTWIWRPLGCFDREILRWLVGELCHGFGQNCPCMHRVCVHWSRFWRSRPEAHAVSCVNTAMIADKPKSSQPLSDLGSGQGMVFVGALFPRQARKYTNDT